MALLSDAEIESGLAGLEGWRREAGAHDSIARDFEFPDFAAAMAFVQRVGEAAEDANHHPDILLHGWNKVRLTLLDALRRRPHRGRLRAGRAGLGARLSGRAGLSLPPAPLATVERPTT